MFKYKQIIKNILSPLSVVIIIAFFIYSIHLYSLNIGLFNNVGIHISGNEYIDSQHIESEIHLDLGASLLSVNLTDIQNKLESIEYIEAIQVSRILPHTLMIHIVERSPILLITKADEITFMDKNGVLLPVNEKSIATFPVPVLSILNENSSLDNNIVDITQFFQFLIDEYPLFYNNLSEVRIQNDVWNFYSDNNTKVFAHASYLTDQFNILKNFEKTVYPTRNLMDYRYIDLRIKDQVIVREKYRKG